MSSYKKEKIRPHLFSREPRAQPGEEFVKIEEDPKYSISNYGRVKVHKKSGTRIIIPYRRASGGKFFVRLTGQNLTSVCDLVYKAFVGEIGEFQKVSFRDADTRNLKLENLSLISVCERTKRKTGMKYMKKTKLADRITSQEIKVAYTSRDKEKKIEKVNNLTRNGYYIATHTPETNKTVGLFLLRAKKLR